MEKDANWIVVIHSGGGKRERERGNVLDWMRIEPRRDGITGETGETFDTWRKFSGSAFPLFKLADATHNRPQSPFPRKKNDRTIANIKKHQLFENHQPKQKSGKNCKRRQQQQEKIDNEHAEWCDGRLPGGLYFDLFCYVAWPSFFFSLLFSLCRDTLSPPFTHSGVGCSLRDFETTKKLNKHTAST